jgi:monoamine oxidase
MEKTDILVIGAGAAGLMAAYKLSQQGKKVIVLEARNRTGGRIHTINQESFFQHAELGAEFVHGDLPVTLNLLKEAGIKYGPATGEMVRYAKGEFTENAEFIEDWDELIERLNELKEDTNIYDFLLIEFPGDKYQGLRDGVWNYVSGYDNADPRKASAFALRREWQNEDEGAQHRVNEGYCSMINYLAKTCREAGNNIYLNSVVKEINWKAAQVKVTTDAGISYEAKQLIIALPLGILQLNSEEKGAIAFHPPVPEQTQALQAIGFGAVIKFLLAFDKPFWESSATQKLAGKSLKTMAFLLSDEDIPTWWTQHPQHSPMLTGWLGGPAAIDKKDNTLDELLQQALQSLSNIFELSVDELKAKLIAWNIINWANEPFTNGSYSYDTVAAPEARKVLNSPVDDTLFFAGEYLYDGPAMGTVEAALTSGVGVAERILK